MVAVADESLERVSLDALCREQIFAAWSLLPSFGFGSFPESACRLWSTPSASPEAVGPSVRNRNRPVSDRSDGALRPVAVFSVQPLAAPGPACSR